MIDVRAMCCIGVIDILLAVMSYIKAMCCIGVMVRFSGCDV